MLFRGGSCRRGSGPSAGAVHKVPTEADANAEEHADNCTKDVGSQHPSEHHLCRLYCLSEAVGWTLHGAAIVLAGTRKSSLVRRRLTPCEASPFQDPAAATIAAEGAPLDHEAVCVKFSKLVMVRG